MGDKIVDQDAELVRKVINGDNKAFRTLVESYKDKSLTIAASIVKNEVLAEDIIQEVFVKVFKKIGGFKFNSKFATWLYRIVVYTSYNTLNQQKSTVPAESFEPYISENFNTVQKDNLSREEQQKYIQLAMKQLRADEALVLRLFYLCELNLNEIEEITEFKKSKIRVDLHRGRKNIYDNLYRMLGGEIKYLL